MSVRNARAAIRLAEEMRPVYESDYDEEGLGIIEQIVKDNKRYIADQEHHLSLLEDMGIE